MRATDRFCRKADADEKHRNGGGRPVWHLSLLFGWSFHNKRINRGDTVRATDQRVEIHFRNYHAVIVGEFRDARHNLAERIDNLG
jgi:hypothetical protein